MRVTVNFFTTLKEIVGSGKVEVNLPKGSDVGKLVEKLSNEYGSNFDNYIIDDTTRKVRQYLQIVVDGKYISLSEKGGIKLRDGSVVSILPPIGGG